MRTAEKWMYKATNGSKLYSFFLRVIFACDIPTSVKVGKNVQLPHNGNGIVMHNKTVIGNNCVIYQGTTLGGNGVIDKDGNVRRGAPILEDGVAVFCGACVLGAITIGHDSYIGANAVVTKDVPPNSLVVGNPAVIKERKITYNFN